MTQKNCLKLSYAFSIVVFTIGGIGILQTVGIYQ